ncbi:unnamed protein product [Brassica rapa]|uniref:Uncharacterized protein n=2 Tax=Brassica TaxID=3705 RepID=A0A8D9HMC4_BRACM|nr:unnamed protein product [Brassica napus]CAG7901224.1 unnamed protein product [Brassica rapa]
MISMALFEARKLVDSSAFLEFVVLCGFENTYINIQESVFIPFKLVLISISSSHYTYINLQ